MERRSEWYDHPEYYEAIFGQDSEVQLDFLEGVSCWYGTGGRRWLEPACGAGRLLQEAARRGYQMTGYDLSLPMLEHARRRLSPAERKRVQVHLGRMEDFCPTRLQGTFDLAFSLVSTFRYLTTEDQVRGHLECTRRLLKPGGIYVLGFHLTDYRRKRPEHERWTGRVGADVVVCNTREWPPDRKARLARMRNRLRITGPKKDWLIETDWHFRTYDQEQALASFEAAGFELVALYDFDHSLERPLTLETDRLDWVCVLRGKRQGVG